jgi:hypothetical protein
MRASPAEYLRLPLRAHDLLRDVRLHDVSTLDLPGGGAGRTIAEIRVLESSTKRSRVEKILWRLRDLLGRVFAWDRVQLQPQDSLRPRLSARDVRNSEVPPGTAMGSFRVLYQFPTEALSEIRNATVQGYVSIALAPIPSGYRFYFAVYVRRVSWLSRPYLIMIEPFRRFILYPAMFRRIRCAWLAKYG